MIPCPSCKRKVFTRRELVYASVDGTAQCPACRRPARLDLLSRWMISCVIALVLPAIFLYGGIFYSGHLFVVSMFLIFGAWRLLCFVGLPLLTLEAAEDGPAIDRRHSILILVALLITAIVLDGFIASRFDEDNASTSSAPHSVSRGESRPL